MPSSFGQAQGRAVAKSTLISRNMTITGRRTSVRLEPEMWMALKEISKREKCSIHDLCGVISFRKNQNTSLTAAIRVFLMLYFRASSTEEGHRRAGHGSFEYMKQRAKISINGRTGAILTKEQADLPHGESGGKPPADDAPALSYAGGGKV